MDKIICSLNNSGACAFAKQARNDLSGEDCRWRLSVDSSDCYSVSTQTGAWKLVPAILMVSGWAAPFYDAWPTSSPGALRRWNHRWRYLNIETLGTRVMHTILNNTLRIFRYVTVKCVTLRVYSINCILAYVWTECSCYTVNLMSKTNFNCEASGLTLEDWRYISYSCF